MRYVNIEFNAYRLIMKQLEDIKTISEKMYVTKCSSTKMNALALELRRVLASSEVKEKPDIDQGVEEKAN